MRHIVYIGMHCHKCGVLLDGYDEQEESREVLCTRDAMIASINPREEELFEEEC